MKKYQIIVFFFLFLSYSIAVGISSVYAANKSHTNIKVNKSQNKETSEEDEDVSASANNSGKGVISKSPYLGAIAMDAVSGKVLFDDHADEKGFPASIIKLMNILLILDAVKEKTISLEDQVTISAEASRIGGSQVFLKEKEVFSVNELLYALMIQSANDAAVALALHLTGSTGAFVDLMNKKAEELGMKNTHFYSVHGLPPGKDQYPDTSTARDLAILAQGLLKYPEILEYTSIKERPFRDDSPNPFIMRNHNHLLGNFEGCDGLKTGYFRKAGFSIVVTGAKNGVRGIVVVMGSDNNKVRDSKAKEILSKGLTELIKTSSQKISPQQTSQSNLIEAAHLEKESPTEIIIPKETQTKPEVPEEEKNDDYYTIRISKSTVKVVGGALMSVIFLVIGISIGRKKKILNMLYLLFMI